MAFSVNQATLVGNATKAAELKYTPNGMAVCNFSMATNRGVKNKETEKWDDIPTFHRIQVWGKLAEYASKEIQKGTKVLVMGRIDNRTYEDKDKITRSISEIVAETLIVFPRGQQVTNDYQEPQPPTEAEQVFTEGGVPVSKPGSKDTDEIPF